MSLTPTGMPWSGPGVPDPRRSVIFLAPARASSARTRAHACTRGSTRSSRSRVLSISSSGDRRPDAIAAAASLRDSSQGSGIAANEARGTRRLGLAGDRRGGDVFDAALRHGPLLLEPLAVIGKAQERVHAAGLVAVPLMIAFVIGRMRRHTKVLARRAQTSFRAHRRRSA